MKPVMLLFFSALMLSIYTFAESPAAVVVAPSAPSVVAPAPIVNVPVAEPAAPPKWAEQMLVTIQGLPYVGPIVSKILLYAGIVSSILTAFIAFLLTVLSALMGVMNMAGLASFAAKIQLFKDSKFMYWLKYLSMFNAKKPEAK